MFHEFLITKNQMIKNKHKICYFVHSELSLYIYLCEIDRTSKWSQWNLASVAWLKTTDQNTMIANETARGPSLPSLVRVRNSAGTLKCQQGKFFSWNFYCSTVFFLPASPWLSAYEHDHMLVLTSHSKACATTMPMVRAHVKNWEQSWSYSPIIFDISNLEPSSRPTGGVFGANFINGYLGGGATKPTSRVSKEPAYVSLSHLSIVWDSNFEFFHLIASENQVQSDRQKSNKLTIQNFPNLK